MKKFEVVYQWTDQEGRLSCIHRGQAMPAHWERYYPAEHPLAAELLRHLKGLGAS
jgi:hypothetical protein